MIRKTASVSLVLLLLTGCSTVIDGSSQEITILTPGTGGALCLLEREGHREHIWTPKTIRITKSGDPMTVTCVAPGNREKTFVLKPEKERSAYMNIATLGAGALYDYKTGAMFKFPKEIVVDFSDVPPSPHPLPEYQKLLAEHPELAGMEAFRPGAAALHSDKDRAPHTLQPRTESERRALMGGLEGESLSPSTALPAATTTTTTKTTSTSGKSADVDSLPDK